MLWNIKILSYSIVKEQWFFRCICRGIPMPEGSIFRKVNRWSGLDEWKWTSHITASWGFSRDTGIEQCLTSQILNIPYCPPIATTCCWLGCLSTQWSGTQSPVSDNIWEDSFPSCLKSYIFNYPMEFTVRTSGVRGKVTAWRVPLPALFIVLTASLWPTLKRFIQPSAPTMAISGLLHTTPVHGTLLQEGLPGPVW